MKYQLNTATYYIVLHKYNILPIYLLQVFVIIMEHTSNFCLLFYLFLFKGIYIFLMLKGWSGNDLSVQYMIATCLMFPPPPPHKRHNVTTPILCEVVNWAFSFVSLNWDYNFDVSGKCNNVNTSSNDFTILRSKPVWSFMSLWRLKVIHMLPVLVIQHSKIEIRFCKEEIIKLWSVVCDHICVWFTGSRLWKPSDITTALCSQNIPSIQTCWHQDVFASSFNYTLYNKPQNLQSCTIMQFEAECSRQNETYA